MALAVPILLHGIYDRIVRSIAVYICAFIVLLLFCRMMLGIHTHILTLAQVYPRGKASRNRLSAND